MSNGEKIYLGRAIRWGLIAIIGVMFGATALICKLVPNNEILKYKDGEFFIYYPRDEYGWISELILGAAAVISLFSVAWEFFIKQYIVDKILHCLQTLFLGFAVFVSFVISACALEGFSLFPYGGLPYGAEEYNIDGHLLLICEEPEGLHHSHPALCEVNNGEVHFIGAGEMHQGRAEDYNIIPTQTGYTVTYTETINGVSEQKSFGTTNDKKEKPE